MRKRKRILAIFFGLTLITSPIYSQVTIGTEKAPEKFSVLELISNQTRGLRLPQLTTQQRDDLTTETFKANEQANGLTIFNISTKCVNVWNGAVWIEWCGQQLPPPETNWKDIPYVGAFWKSNQVGERCIYSGHTGEWTATVLYTPRVVPFVNLEAFTGPTDPNYKTDNPGDAENYPVTNGANSISGTGNIAFRIGLTGTLSLTLPRYAKIELKWTDASPLDKTSYIYIRQGEMDDYAPGQVNGTLWSVYNLGNANNFMNFPTQAGYFYQWSNTPTAWSPVDPIIIVTPPWNNNYDMEDFSLGNSSPTGYKLPLSTDISTLLSNASHVVGYYADGWFDRRKIVQSVTYGAVDGNYLIPTYNSPYDKTAVSATTPNVGYIGILFFFDIMNTSLFFPITGYRFGDVISEPGGKSGGFAQAGASTNYWASDSKAGPGWGNYGNPYSLGLNIMSATGLSYSLSNYAYPVRCVKQ